jgi:hypothetical protein
MHAGFAVSFIEKTNLKNLIENTGHEQPNRSIPEGIRNVLSYGELSIDNVAQTALSSLVDELQYANRFRGETTFAQGVGEESGTHSVHVARLVIAVADAVSSKEGNELSSELGRELIQFKQDGAIAGFIHDLGEVLVGEFSTVRERAEKRGNHTEEESSADLERLIFVRSAALALHFAENGGDFKRVMEEIREPLLENINRLTLKSLKTAFDRYPVELSPHSESILEHWIELYDATESTTGTSPSQEDKFVGTCVKILERVQGQHHFLRFSKKEPTVIDFSVEGIIYAPWEESQRDAPLHSEQLRSNLVMAQLVRMEGKLGELFELAETDAQKAIAREIRNRVYSGVLESLDILTPVVKRTLEDPNEAITQRLKDAQARGEDAVPILEEEYKELLHAYRELRNTNRSQEARSHANSQLLPIETRLRLQALYRAALETSYEPRPGEILALQDAIPEKFLPVNLLTVGLSRRKS